MTVLRGKAIEQRRMRRKVEQVETDDIHRDAVAQAETPRVALERFRPPRRQNQRMARLGIGPRQGPRDIGSPRPGS